MSINLTPSLAHAMIASFEHASTHPEKPLVIYDTKTKEYNISFTKPSSKEALYKRIVKVSNLHINPRDLSALSSGFSDKKLSQLSRACRNMHQQTNLASSIDKFKKERKEFKQERKSQSLDASSFETVTTKSASSDIETLSSSELDLSLSTIKARFDIKDIDKLPSIMRQVEDVRQQVKELQEETKLYGEVTKAVKDYREAFLIEEDEKFLVGNLVEFKDLVR
ncbi:MAG: hypothetical protein FJZ56_00355 [Chlamydiae bacterium]|nr:hypothetical protein [Chlamydiota bacterium]